MRIIDHPVLGHGTCGKEIIIEVNGEGIPAIIGEPIAAALMASGIVIFRKTPKRSEPRGLFCAIGRCTDCVMTVNGIPNIRTCVTTVQEGMKIQTQQGLGKYKG